MQPNAPQRPVIDVTAPRRPMQPTGPRPSMQPPATAAASIATPAPAEKPAPATQDVTPATASAAVEMNTPPAPSVPIEATPAPAAAAPAAQDKPSEALPFHEAPTIDDDEPAPLQQKTNDDTDEAMPELPTQIETENLAPTQPPGPAKPDHPLPIGAIFLAVFFMLGLSALTVMVYLQS